MLVIPTALLFLGSLYYIILMVNDQEVFDCGHEHSLLCPSMFILAFTDHNYSCTLIRCNQSIIRITWLSIDVGYTFCYRDLLFILSVRENTSLITPLDISMKKLKLSTYSNKISYNIQWLTLWNTRIKNKYQYLWFISCQALVLMATESKSLIKK